ncbi:MAG: hypothetical protein HY246_26710 [Proteobacteria bacterium]|nr:hypothetical protein [Pseudomonadota bacterium]
MPTTSQVQRTRETVDFLAQQPVPVPVNAVHVDSSGQMTSSLTNRMAFTFVFAGALFDVAAETVGSAIRLALRADLGPLPYSAEHVAARHALIRLLAEHGHQLALSDAQTIQVHAALDVAQPATPVTILTEITAFLLAVKPNLVRVADHLPKAAASAMIASGP